MSLCRTLLSSIFISFTVLIITACSSESEGELVKFVKNTEFTVPVFYLERSGDFHTDRWYKVVLYFGYGDDWNLRACEEDALRFNKETPSPIKFRCVKGN